MTTASRDPTDRPAPEGEPTTRERILAAAERVFAETGFAGARTRDIAALARTNISQLHYYFESKEKLYAAVIREFFERVGVRIRRAVDAPGTPLERIARIAETHFDIIAEHPNFPRIVIDAILRAPHVAREVVGTTIRPILESLAGAFLEAIAAGAVRPVDPRHAIISALGMNLVYFIAKPHMAELFGDDAYSPERLAERRAAIVDLLLHGITPRKEDRS